MSPVAAGPGLGGQAQTQPLLNDLRPPAHSFSLSEEPISLSPRWEHPQDTSPALALLSPPRFCVAEHFLGPFNGTWAEVAAPQPPHRYKGG